MTMSFSLALALLLALAAPLARAGGCGPNDPLVAADGKSHTLTLEDMIVCVNATAPARTAPEHSSSGRAQSLWLHVDRVEWPDELGGVALCALFVQNDPTKANNAVGCGTGPFSIALTAGCYDDFKQSSQLPGIAQIGMTLQTCIFSTMGNNDCPLYQSYPQIAKAKITFHFEWSGAVYC